MKVKNIPFDEIRIPLYATDSKEKLLQHSPAGKVPVLKSNDILIWDSLAICEYLAERYPDKNCWPSTPKTKAWARSISSEMHSSFFELRNTLPMNCAANLKFGPIKNDLQGEIDRIRDIWQQCRQFYGKDGMFLFGDFSIADAMYAPVVLRFNSYQIEVGTLEKEYMASILALPAIQSWIEDGLRETEIIAEAEGNSNI